MRAWGACGPSSILGTPTKQYMNTRIIKRVNWIKLIIVLLTIPPLFFWIASGVSILYINYLGPWVSLFGQVSEFFIFLFFPFSGLFISILHWRKNPDKFYKLFLILNLLLLVLIVVGSLYLS